jgi:hypothetical protein
MADSIQLSLIISGAAQTNPPGCSLKGDVNGSGSVDIVDALLIAQSYVGLTHRFC